MLNRWMLSTIGVVFLSACMGNQSPVAKFELVGGAVGSDGNLSLDASSSFDSDGSIVSYAWSFGDGESASGTKANHTYKTSGKYQVSLTVMDNQGAASTSSRSIDVTITNTPPKSKLTASTLRGVAPLTVTLDGAGSWDPDGGEVTYQWLIDGKEVSTKQIFSYVFESVNTFTVSLVVRDDEGLVTTETREVVVVSGEDRFTLSGQINSIAYSDVDGDVNDPSARYLNNDGHTKDNIQGVTNPVMLNGFVAAIPTGLAGDAFGDKEDWQDIFAVTLRKGDYVSMQVIDFDLADIDLLLLDANNMEVLVSSTGSEEFESLQAPDDGKYYVMVAAVNDYSKYLLKIGETSLVAGAMAQGQSADFEPEQLIMKTRKPSSGGSSMKRAQLRMSHSKHTRPALAHINALNPQTRDALGIGYKRNSFEQLVEEVNPRAAAKLRTLRAMKQLRKEVDVEIVEPNYRVKPFLIPNDPLYRYQWHFPAINLPQAWDITRGDKSVIVAVVDSGIYSAHPDLKGQTVKGYDFVADLGMSNDGDGIDPNPEDPGDNNFSGSSSWHGSHVAGIVAAQMNNFEGGVGVAPGVKVMPVRAIGFGGGVTYDVMQAVRYAAGLENDSGTLPEKPASIINLSLGGGGFSSIGQQLYDEVRKKGIIVVAASGNQNTGEAMYPASFDGVISVAGTDFDGKRAPYSNYGAFVDISAPGGNNATDRNRDGYSDGILSAGVLEGSTTGKKSGYVLYQGTSMASPHVAGVVALMKSVYPDLTPDELDSLIISGAINKDLGEPGRDDLYGYGLIDAFLAVNAARALANGGETVAVATNSNIVAFDNLTNSGVISLHAIGSGTVAVTDYRSSDEWLSVAAAEIDENGLGNYSVTINRAGLADGNYRGFVEFDASNGQLIKIQVNVRIGELLETGYAGYLYVFLVKSGSFDIVDVQEVDSVDGHYSFSFTNLPPGDYHLSAGSDIDNDTYVCYLGESCGFYPNINEYGNIELYQNRSNIDFSVGLYNSISVTTTSTEGVRGLRLPFEMKR